MGQLKKQSVTNNFIFQFVYQTLMLIIPLIIAPYLTRTLGDEALGIYTYANSIAYYFLLFANLGIARYGQRVIAKCSDTLQLRQNFWSLFSLHAIFSVISIILYLSFVAITIKEYSQVYWIQTIYVLSALFDITWLFYGLENFKSVAIRNFVIKTIELICIFAFVKSSNDLAIYALISSVAWLVGQAIMLPQAIVIVKPIKFSIKDMLQHLKPLLIFFLSVVAISLYTVFDKTLLGLLSTKENVAYYEYANKIILIPRTFIAVIGTVLYPRACKMVSEGNAKGQLKYLDLSITMVAFIGMASLFGILSVAELVALVYYGEAFIQSGYIMMGMAILPLICGLGEIIRAQYMIPNGMDKQYLRCIILNAVINLIFSSALIPILGVYGAVIGTCAAEIFGCIYQIYLCRNFVKPLLIIKGMFPFAIIGLIMYVVLKIESLFLNNDILSLGIQVFSGALIYIVLTLIYVRFWKKDYWEIIRKFTTKRRIIK